MDFMTSSQRSRAMSAVRGHDTQIEKALRSQLHQRGFRFKKNVKDLPGRPDIVLPKYHCVIFVHGCFWHHHKNCKRSKLPTTRHTFWREKIETNAKRDRAQISALRHRGWRVFVIWECQLQRKTTQVVENLISKIESERM
jgi:DNA mismatch endonuclease (patch repair protein)